MGKFSRFRAAVAVLVLAVVATACNGGGGSGDPQRDLREALQAMGEWTGLTMRLSLDSDPASLTALSAAEGQPLPEEAAAHILDGSLTVSMVTDEDAAVAELTPFQLALRVGDDALVELRGSDDTAYVRVDLPRILGLFGQDEEMVAGIEAMLGSALPPDALRGQWLSLRDAGTLMEAMTGGMSTPTPDPEQEAAFERLAGAFANAAEVTSDGSDDAGQRLRVRGNVRDFYDAVKAEAEALGLPLTGLDDRDEVPDEMVEVLVWLRDGSVSQVEVDLLQLAALDPEADVPEGVERLAMRIEVSQFDGNIDVPGDAVELNAQQLMQTFFETMGGGFMGGEGGLPGMGAELDASVTPGFDPAQMFDEETRAQYCEQVRDMPQDMIDQHFAEICPELAS